MANRIGSAAKSSSRRCLTFVNVTTPTAPRAVLPTKFAVAEKHMARYLVCEITLVAPESKLFCMVQDKATCVTVLHSHWRRLPCRKRLDPTPMRFFSYFV